MNRFHRSSEHDIKTSQHEVFASLEKSGLEKSSTLVMGGSALALAGLRPAHDVDLMVLSTTYHHLLELGHTPGGQLLRSKLGSRRPFLETLPGHIPAGILSLDITLPQDDHAQRAGVDLDMAFQDQLDEFPSLNGYRYLPPQLVAAHKAAIGRRKDRQDCRLIREHLKKELPAS